LIKDHSNPFPHQIASEKDFNFYMKKMNISQDDIIVCYDTKGLFSAPFVWFTFKIFGSNSVFVFNGNLENWQKINGQFDSTKY